MTTKQPKPPKQLRVTLKEQIEHEYNDDYSARTSTVVAPLGFAIPYVTTTKQYAKSKESQDDWAYGHDSRRQWNRTYSVDADGQYWTDTWRWEERPGMEGWRDRGISSDVALERVRTSAIVPPQYQPIIVDNVPLEGFRIQHMVARHRGNKLWRVLDPRGFELEILSGTFEELVMSGAVDRGLIIGPCIWQTGKKLVRA